MHWTAALGALTCTAALFVRLASLMTLGVLAFGVAILENRHASSRLRSRVAFSGGRAQRKDRGPRAPLGYPYGIAPRVHRGRTAFAGGRCLPRPDIRHYKRGGPRAGAVTWGPTTRRDEA